MDLSNYLLNVGPVCAIEPVVSLKRKTETKVLSHKQDVGPF